MKILEGTEGKFKIRARWGSGATRKGNGRGKDKDTGSNKTAKKIEERKGSRWKWNSKWSMEADAKKK